MRNTQLSNKRRNGNFELGKKSIQKVTITNFKDSLVMACDGRNVGSSENYLPISSMVSVNCYFIHGRSQMVHLADEAAVSLTGPEFVPLVTSGLI